jgi:uroporphyrinogen decarboxylase
VPLFDEGLRKGVIEDWLAQGVIDHPDLDRLFTYDHREEISIEQEHGLEFADIAAHPNALALLRDGLEASLAPRVPVDLESRAAEWAERDYPLFLRVHDGLFLGMGIGDGDSFIRNIYTLADHAEFVRRALTLICEYTIEWARQVTRQVEVDAAVFSEPIATSHGPLVSPQTYREVVLPAYRPLMQALRLAGVSTLIWRTYANSRALLDCAVEAGFNCLWAVETGTDAMDYRAIRRQYGLRLRLIGGVDLDSLRGDRRLSQSKARSEEQSKTEIQRQLDEIVRPLLNHGAYIPLADGRVRVGMPFENYAFYRRRLDEIVGV